MNFSIRLRLIHIFNHLMLIPAVLMGSWADWAIAIVWWNIVGTIGISAIFHRLLSHRSYVAPVWFRSLGMALGCLAVGGTPIGWVGVHRQHHMGADSPVDPHSPHAIGFLRSYFHLWGNIQIRRRHVRDLLKQPDVIFFHRNYFLVIGAWALFLYSVDFELGIFLFSIPAVFAFHAYGFINAFGHLWGYRSHNTKDDSRNNLVVNLLTCGEGWHNNHHNDPANHRIGQLWWEWDPAAWLIERFGFARR